MVVEMLPEDLMPSVMVAIVMVVVIVDDGSDVGQLPRYGMAHL